MAAEYCEIDRARIREEFILDPIVLVKQTHDLQPPQIFAGGPKFWWDSLNMEAVPGQFSVGALCKLFWELEGQDIVSESPMTLESEKLMVWKTLVQIQEFVVLEVVKEEEIRRIILR